MNPRVSTMDAIPAHVGMMAETLAGDPRFIGVNYRRLLWRSYRGSIICRTGFWDDEIAAMWGCSGTPLGAAAELWLCTNKVAESHPTYFIRAIREELPRIFEIYPKVGGKVSTFYQSAPGFLKYLGFDLGVAVDGKTQMFWGTRP